MVTFSTQNFLDENNWTTTQISLVNCGLILDNAINYVNLRAVRTIAAVAAGGVTCTAAESTAVKAVGVLMVRGFLDRGPNVSAGSVSVSSLSSDPQYSFWRDMAELSIKALLTAPVASRSFLRT